jgi:hypothetical protein
VDLRLSTGPNEPHELNSAVMNLTDIDYWIGDGKLFKYNLVVTEPQGWQHHAKVYYRHYCGETAVIIINTIEAE